MHWGPRTIDLDLLLYDDQVVDEPDLQVPHPQMHLRSFVLKGLCEFASDFVHPVIGRPLKELFKRLNSSDYFPDKSRPQLVSIAGGALPSAETSSVLVVTRDKESKPLAKLVNLQEIISEGKQHYPLYSM